MKRYNKMGSPSFHRREFLSVAGLGAVTFAAPAFLHSAEQKRKPSILLILTDDQGWGDIHSHGNRVLETPVLDELAESGARFDRFFVSPVCAPTRASLLTGRYHPRTGTHGVTRGYETMRVEEVTLAEILKQNGYRTGCFGKWHNGAHFPYHPNGQGFDEFYGFCAGHWNNYFDTTLEQNGEEIKSTGYITDYLTDRAIDFIRSHQKMPFLCYVPYNAPHSPWQVPDRYFDKYKAKGLDDVTACAYAMVENVDENIGRLLKTLDELNLAEDTIVLFLTDNGPNSDRYNGNMKGRKGSTDEGGIRVPLFIRWQGRIKAGTVIEPIAAHIDLLPTLTELCGISGYQTLPLDGVCLVPLLMQKDVVWNDRMLFDRWNRRGTVRTQRWRAVTNGKEWWLYDMENDPEQKYDVAEENPELLEQFKSAYEQWERDGDVKGFDPIPIPIGYAERPEVVLPGHEAFFVPGQNQGISYEGPSGWANDYVANWTETDSYPFWEVEVVTPGRYEFTLNYICSKDNVGAEIRLEIQDKSLAGRIDQVHDPEPLPSPDRSPRREVFEKVWKPLTLGTLEMQPGRTQLRVRAISMPGKEVMDVKSVRVRKMG
ncbi:MAG: arylsulfatase [bacterium]